VLSLYGELAAAMAPGTFVSGEGASVAPLEGSYYRSMYLPPNAASNGSFLETLRLMLVHERPHGLDLAFATPRAWLRPGRTVGVTQMPTRFGRLSYEIRSLAESVEVSVDVPQDGTLRTLTLRLRLPRGRHASVATVGGRAIGRFDPRTETLSLPVRAGHLDIGVAVT
jgi:hypothetical protein